MHAKVADTAPFRDVADDEDNASDAFVDSDVAARDDASTNTRVKASTSTADATQQSSRVKMDAKVLAAVACACAALVYTCVKMIRTRMGGGSDRAFAKSHRKCNRCGKRGANTRCDRCKRAWYCSSACRSAAWKMEICECC